MGRKKETVLRSCFSFNPDTNTSTCKKCNVPLSGNFFTNLKKHIQIKHPEMYAAITADHEDGAAVPAKKLKRVVVHTNEDLMANSCVHLTTKDGVPFSTLDSEGLRHVFDQIYKGLGMPIINSHNIEQHITAKADAIKRDITDMCRDKLLCVKIDMATRLNRSILGVNIQVIRENKIIVKTLAMLEIFQRHTAEVLKDEICAILRRYNIDLHQIYSFTTDNGSNLIKAVNLLREQYHLDHGDDTEEENGDEENENEVEQLLDNITFDSFETTRCAAHTLQLAVQEVLRKDTTIEDVLTEARTLCKTLRTPSFTQMISSLGLVKPALDVPTRWNSTITMLETLVPYKTFCKNNEGKFPKLKMTEADWKSIAEIIDTFIPVKEITLKLQNSQLVFGDFIKHFITLKLQVQKKRGHLALKLESALQKRESSLLNTATATTAAFLDPRIFRILSSEQKQLARNHMQKIIAKIFKVKANARNDSANLSIPSSAGSANMLLASFHEVTRMHCR